jgi:hypothetical protein
VVSVGAYHLLRFRLLGKEHRFGELWKNIDETVREYIADVGKVIVSV